MAIILAAQNGIWTNPTTWIGGVVPEPGDIAVANNKVITVDQSVTCIEVRNDTVGGATDGGRFNLTINATLTANVYTGATPLSGCVFASTTGTSAIIGDVHTGTGCIGARNGGTQQFFIYGTVYGNGYGPGSTGITGSTYGAFNASTGTLYVLRTVAGARGMPAIYGPFTYINPRSAQNIVRATNSLTEVVLKDVVGWTPDPSDALLGTEYEGRIGIWTPKNNQRIEIK